MSRTPLLLATGNTGKLKEFQALLKSDFDVSAPAKDSLTVPEDAATYFENCLKKAMAYQKRFQMAVLADDSGIEVDALDGQPGVGTADYGGPGLSFPERWTLLLEALKGVPPSKRTARFRTVLCYFDGVGVPVFFQGTCEGHILEAPSGGGGFGYDPIFFSADLGKSFGDATVAEKAGCSHRAAAVKELLRWRHLTTRSP